MSMIWTEIVCGWNDESSWLWWWWWPASEYYCQMLRTVSSYVHVFWCSSSSSTGKCLWKLEGILCVEADWRDWRNELLTLYMLLAWSHTDTLTQVAQLSWPVGFAAARLRMQNAKYLLTQWTTWGKKGGKNFISATCKERTVGTSCFSSSLVRH